MRLLLIIPNIESFHGFFTELSLVLVERGVEVHCACSQRALWGLKDHRSDSLVQIHEISFARGFNLVEHLKASYQLNRLVSSIRPDIVHAHFSAAIFTTALAKRSYWPLTIGTFHGVGFPLMTGMKARIIKVAETQATSRFDEVWVLTDDDRAVLGAAVPGVPVKRHLSYGLGCDLDRFDQAKISSSEREQLRSQLGLTADNFVFTFIGRFVSFKGFDLTVRAFLKLAQSNPHVRLLLLGGPDNLHPTGLTLAEERAMNNSPQILNLGPQNEIQKYLSLAQAMVFPSQREGMPVCLMEALALGVPVITQNARGCRDVVRDQIDGLVLHDCTVDTLAASMKLLVDDKTLREQLATQALAGRARLSRLNYIQEQVQIYEKLSLVD